MNKNLFEAKTFIGKKVTGCYVLGFEKGKEYHTIVNQTKKQEITGRFTSYIVNPKTVKFIENKTKLQDYMLQQLLGFRLGKQGFSIIDLINGAGLTKQEWINIKDETDITSLEESDLKDIEDYVNNLKVIQCVSKIREDTKQ